MKPAPSLRPTRYDESSGSITVTLTDEDLALGYRAGIARYRSQRGVGNHDAAFRTGEGARNDIEGAIGEIAFWLLCGRQPPTEMVLSIVDWKRERGPAGGCLRDVLGTEIRATHHRDGRLIIHRTSSRDGESKDDCAFILAIVDENFFYPNETTFRTGDPDLDGDLEARRIPVYGREVSFKGWCHGRDATQVFSGMTHPDFAVRQEELRGMASLAKTYGLFEVPAERIPWRKAKEEADLLIAEILSDEQIGFLLG